MRGLVVYDTEFGNTERIARAIGEGLASLGEVRVASAAEATLVPPPDLLFVGGPTQRHRMSPALAALLESLPRRSLRGVRAAAFDTRYRMARLLTGSAAADAGRRLERAGCQMIASPESFFIERDRPPDGEKRRHHLEQLEPGELERARQWAGDLAASLAPGAMPARTATGR
jgi:flavodoxin